MSQRWRETKVRDEIEHFMYIQHNVKRVYQLGSLPPMLLALTGRNQDIPQVRLHTAILALIKPLNWRIQFSPQCCSRSPAPTRISLR
eukprot:119619-Prorocentrum_minimum.AAC.2